MAASARARGHSEGVSGRAQGAAGEACGRQGTDVQGLAAGAGARGRRAGGRARQERAAGRCGAREAHGVGARGVRPGRAWACLCAQAGPVGCSCTRLGFQPGFSTRYFS